MTEPTERTVVEIVATDQRDRWILEAYLRRQNDPERRLWQYDAIAED